ncbi:MAG TPA: hypothetical protein VI485_05850 [Vicinamibacterales bacterium]|nr:hypothetical protein [Vicinamibacterales bacterium]
MTRAVHRFRVVVVAFALMVPSVARAQESKSALIATELTRLLDAMKLDSIAARQESADQYVGALYIAGSQLLVVSAKYSMPLRMDYLLGQKKYQDAYADLSSASEQQSKVFVMDLGANGLRFKRENNQPFDTADVSGKSVVFDGNWGKAKITEAEYRKAFEATDAQYAQMLQALVAALKKSS